MNRSDIIKTSNYIVRESCENTSTGNWIIYADEIASALGVTEEDIIRFQEEIMDEMWKRDEVLDACFDNNGFDMICALAYCPQYEWCDDEYTFDCTYEEWMENPVEPIVDAPLV